MSITSLLFHRPPRLLALAATFAITACGGGDPYRTLTPLERHLYLEPTGVATTLSFTRAVNGYESSCMLTADGRAWCWGRNEDGALGADTAERCMGGNVPCTWQPVASQAALRFAAFSIAQRHGCGIDLAGLAWCWGFGQGGQLGNGARADSRAPVRVAGNHDFVSLDAGQYGLLSCALDRVGVAWCWGPAGGGALGDGTTNASSAPVQVLSTMPFAAVGAGDGFACALDTGGRAWCWGVNNYGRLGIGRDGAATRPEAVVDSHRFVQLAVGGQHACALDGAGQAWCWGFGASLGDGAAEAQHRDRPVAVAGGHVFTALRAGYQHTCALTADGQAWCWGPMGALLGYGSEINPTAPVAVTGGYRFRTLAVGGVSTCGITLTGQTLCWGINSTGAVGQSNVDR